MAPGASGAVGERSVSVAGDVVGSLIVTGDNNNVNLLLGAREGALLEQLARRATPAKKLRPAPVPSIPPAFADSLDREGEVRAVELAEHPFFVGTLFLPQHISTAKDPHPLICGFVRACGPAD